MYVDPQIKKFVEELASQEAPHPVEMGLEAAREGFSQLWRMVNPENRELERNEDLFIPGPSGDIRCKLYVPKGTTGPLPILAYFHGGGMCLMSPEDFEGTNTIISDDAKCKLMGWSSRRMLDRYNHTTFNDAKDESVRLPPIDL